MASALPEAAGNNVGILADVQGLTHVVVGDQNANAFVPKVPDDVFDVTDGYGVHTGEGFIQQDKSRLHGQCPGNLHPSGS